MKLAEYDFDIIYRKGKANANADAMSRTDPNDQQDQMNENIEKLCSIYETNKTMNKTAFLAAIQSFETYKDNIEYKTEDLFRSKEAIAVCIPANFEKLTGIAGHICTLL